MSALLTGTIGVLASLGVTALSGVLFGRLADVSAFVRMRPTLVRAGILAAVSIAFFALLYEFVFTATACRGGRSDVSCMLNANQGVLATFSLIVAGLTLLLTVVTRESLDLREERAEKDRLALRMQLVVKEIIHNLMHVALSVGSTGEDMPTAFPNMSLDEVKRLSEFTRGDLINPCVLD